MIGMTTKISTSSNEVSFSVISNYYKLSFYHEDNYKYGLGFSCFNSKIEIEYNNFLFKFDYGCNSLSMDVTGLYIPYTIYKNYINKKAYLTVYSKKLKDKKPIKISTIEGIILIDNLVYDIIDKKIYFKHLSFINKKSEDNDNAFELIEFLKRMDTITDSKYIIITIRVE